MSYSAAAASNGETTGLFTPDECFKIFESFMSKLSQCHSKAQQIRAIAEFVFSNLGQNGSP